MKRESDDSKVGLSRAGNGYGGGGAWPALERGGEVEKRWRRSSSGEAYLRRGQDLPLHASTCCMDAGRNVTCSYHDKRVELQGGCT